MPEEPPIYEGEGALSEQITSPDTINTFNKSLTLINTNLELKSFLLQLIFKNKKEIVIETRFTIFAT
jgi:hypothetical protein